MCVYCNLRNRELSIDQQNRDCHSETIQMFLCSVQLLYTLIRVALEGRKSTLQNNYARHWSSKCPPLVTAICIMP